MQTRCLSLHASYSCRHRGACCGTWQVPAEPHVIAFVRRVSRGAGGEGFLVTDGASPHLAHKGGACVFRSGSRCRIHQEAGEMALPVSCRHFPRVVLRDPRGTLISLSHYCPTAAALLFEDAGDLRSTAAGESLALSEPIEGLDARDTLPPLLHPGMLADIDGYDAWERAAIDTLAVERHAGRALLEIEAATEDVRRWTPARGSLATAVIAAFGEARPRALDRSRRPRELAVVRTLYQGDLPLVAPPDLDWAWDVAVPSQRADLHRPVANYLAARMFGNWVAYQGYGLRSVVAWLRACHDVLRVTALAGRTAASGALSTEELLEAIRLADLVMLHSVDSHPFARKAAAFEKELAA